MPRFSNFLKNSTNDFSMFLYLVTCFLRVTVSLLVRGSQGRTILSPISNLDMDKLHGTCISDTACNPHSNETVTLGKHVYNYKNLGKRMI